MKILNYNVNGIRAAESKGLSEYIKKENPDIICFQEIKALENQIPDSILSLDYYGFWHPAQKKGYSGVGILSKIKPQKIELGCGEEWIDNEGRIIRIDFENFSVMSVYMPSGTTGELRQEIKYKFLDFFYSYIQGLINDQMPHLIVCGDFNICHQDIDIHDPKGNAKSSGFLPEERAWMSKWFKDLMIDGFRELHPEPHQYTWWSFRANARQNNKGWRIDYCTLSHFMKDRLLDSFIHPHITYSDHCPTGLILK